MQGWELSWGLCYLYQPRKARHVAGKRKDSSIWGCNLFFPLVCHHLNCWGKLDKPWTLFGGEFIVLNRESCLAAAHLSFHCCSTESVCNPKSRSVFASCRYSNKCWKQLKWALQTAVCTFSISGEILPMMNGESCLYAVGFGFKAADKLMSTPLGPWHFHIIFITMPVPSSAVKV